MAHARHASPQTGECVLVVIVCLALWVVLCVRSRIGLILFCPLILIGDLSFYFWIFDLISWFVLSDFFLPSIWWWFLFHLHWVVCFFFLPSIWWWFFISLLFLEHVGCRSCCSSSVAGRWPVVAGVRLAGDFEISSSLADTVWSGPPTVGDGRLDSVVDCNARTPGVMGARRGRRHVSAGWSSLDIAWILSDGLRGTFIFWCLHHLCDIMFCFLVFQYAAECCDWIRGSVENS